MADKPIAVGDLVICIGAKNIICFPFIGSIRTVREQSKYYADHWSLSPPTITPDGIEIDWLTCRLKRIDPPALPESVQTEEKVSA